MPCRERRVIRQRTGLRQVDFMNVLLDEKVDVISMMDVLEHIPYPARALEKANMLLRPGGLLVISLPDLTSSSWRIMDAMGTNPYWMEIEHHHNFSRSRLARLLKQWGFIIADFAVPYRYKAHRQTSRCVVSCFWNSEDLYSKESCNSLSIFFR